MSGGHDDVLRDLREKVDIVMADTQDVQYTSEEEMKEVLELFIALVDNMLVASMTGRLAQARIYAAASLTIARQHEAVVERMRG